MIRPGIRRLFRLAFHRREDAERDVDDEIRLHLDLRTEELIGTGLSRDIARVEAEHRFASSDEARRLLYATATHRETHMRKREIVESFVLDLRYLVRSLRRSPTFVVSAVLTLALGLGANAALFAILDRMFLQAPAGVSEPGQLRRVYHSYVNSQGVRQTIANFSPPEFRALAAAAPAGMSVTGFTTRAQVHLGRDDSAPQGVVTYILGDYFGTLGVRPMAGRSFDPDERRAEVFAPVAVISDEFARARHGSEQNAIGKAFDMGSHRYTIIGVAPPGFRGTDLYAADAWVPMNTMGMWTDRDMQWYERKGTLMIRTIARASDPAAFPAFQPVAASAIRSAAMRPDTLSGAVFGPIQEALAPGFNRSEQAIATRLAVVALTILLIACANVANLLLSRALQRRREIGVRLALGVSRARLVRQLLTESLVLAVISLAAALAVAVWTATALRHALLPDVQWGAPAIGWRAIAFAAATAVLAGLAAGLVPALHASRPDVTRVLKGGARGGGLPRSRVRSVLLVSQLAMSCVLLAGAGLFVRSLQQVESVDTGYDQQQIIFASLRSDPELGKRSTELDALLKEAAGRIEQLPGVEHVAYTENVPMYGFSFVNNFLPDRDSVPLLDGSGPIVSFLSPGFFATMGMRLIAGRDFDANDRTGAELVLLVNAAMAKNIWPGESAVGKCLILHKRENPCRRIVGVVSNAHFGRIIERPSMQFYVPLAQEGDEGRTGRAGALEVRAAPGRAAAVTPQVRRILASMGWAGSTPWTRTLAEQLAPELRPWRLGAALFTAAGFLALLVAAVGVYGTIAYTFSQRTHEIGVRIALGAQGANIIALVLRSCVTVGVVGVVIGTAVSLGAGRFAAPLLYQTSPRNPVVLGGVAIVLLAVAVLAGLVPALRAKRVDPNEALRAD
jgi:putative ABC transport system permease protein